ncbi:MAG: spore photoproduct lyase family protein [Candidatus Omnitrophota bacterium]
MNDISEIKKYVEENFRDFGVNKKQETERLLYEIAKREKIDFKKVAGDLSEEAVDFWQIKKYLLERRFPAAVKSAPNANYYLPALDIKKDCEVKITGGEINPKRVYIEEAVSQSYLAKKIKAKFQDAEFINIPSLKQHIKSKKFDLKDYNERRDNFFIVKEKYDFFKKCPCTKGALSCGYHIFNLGSGCIFECTYCYLQDYINAPGIILPANIEDFFASFDKYNCKMRLGTGEFADSLALDDITGFSPLLVEFFSRHPQCVFELKTKSNNVDTLLGADAVKNVVVAWSLNPEKIIGENEFYSANLTGRLEAARKCVDKGFDVAFHFDPIVYYEGWERDYEDVVNLLFDKIEARRVRWISLGTFRFYRGLKKVIENRFPASNILDGELFPGYDGKMRYAENVRLDIYKKMLGWIRKRAKDVFVYLCMENKDICGECGSAKIKTDIWQ